MISLKICTRKAFVVETQLLTSGSVGIEVEFSFSDAWDDLNKVAVFRGSGANIDMVLTGDSCTVPPEVLAQPGGHLMIGVYGTNGAGTIVIPTVWANAGPILLGAIPSGIEPEEITPSLLQQLLDLIHGGSGELYIVDYDQSASTRPDVDEIVAAFDAGKAVLACATDADGGGHALPLAEITRESGAVTALTFSAGGWSLAATKMFATWAWFLTKDEPPAEDLVLTFSASWNDDAEAYAVTTTATRAQVDEALAAGQRIEARLMIDNRQLLRQGTVYAERSGSRLNSVTIGFFGGAGEIWELSGTGGGWELEQRAIGGGSIELDTTLSQPGKAADAAAVGTALAAKGTYSKPSGGIPASDLASAVQTSLGKADTAYQKPSGGIPKTDLASAVQTSLGKADAAYQKPSGGIPATDLAAGVIPDLSGYATEQWVENQGYLKQHQSLVNYQPKSITDTGGYYTTDTVEGALQEIGAELAGALVLDETLTQRGAAADAAAVGRALANSGGMTDAVKQALLNCFEHVAWIDDQGQTYYNALYNALYPPISLDHITAVFNQGSAEIRTTDDLNVLRQYLTVTAYYDDSSTEEISAYTLFGELMEGTSTITAAYGGKTATFDVNVTEPSANVQRDGSTLYIIGASAIRNESTLVIS